MIQANPCKRHYKKRNAATERGNKNRDISYVYHILSMDNSRKPVCSKMFLQTFNVSYKFVRNTFATKNIHAANKHAINGKASGIKVNAKIKEMIVNHIKSFPVLPSHYARSDTMKLYLPCNLSVSKMHALYNESNPDNKVSYQMYLSVFNSNLLNLGFGELRKDKCDKCISNVDPDHKIKWTTQLSKNAGMWKMLQILKM